MHPRRAVFAAVALALCACGLDLAGEELVQRPAPSGSSEPTAADASPQGPGDVGSDDSSVPSNVGILGPSGQDAAPTGAPQSDSGDNGGPPGPPGRGADASSVDASTPCALLEQCCPRVLAPPLVLACLASATRDAGEASCAATLATLVDAGICP